MPLRSFKLRYFDEHVWIVPALGLDGCPFAGPGVDLRGDEARDVLDRSTPLREVLASFEPGIVLRTLSLDLERRRLLATLAPETQGDRPRVVRIDASTGAALALVLQAADRLLPVLEAYVARKLAARTRD